MLLGSGIIILDKSRKIVRAWQENGYKGDGMKIRSFIAIDLPDSIKDALARVGQELRDQVPRRSLRWSRVSGIHLTLKFLGDVEEADLSKIGDVLKQVGGRHTSFTLSVGGVGCFPNPRRPRVVWVGVQEDSGALRALQRDVEKSLAPLGFEREKRSFHPHLTLGRARRNVSSTDQRRLGEIIAATELGELGQVQVASFRLMRSDLRPDGAVYTLLAAFELLDADAHVAARR